MSYQLRLEGRSNYISLSRQYKDLVLYCRHSNKFFFVVVDNEDMLERLKTNRYFQAVMEITENIPLYKVAMNMQMGKSASTTKKRLSVVNLEVIECRDKSVPHDVYKLIF